jgi:DNA-binding protein
MPLSISSFYKILKKAGASRVSDEAAIELRDAVQEIANEKAREAATLCRHANRRTVMKQDIEFVFKKPEKK